jgi:hypothetical protein
MTTLKDIVKAYKAIDVARERYRQTLRDGLENGVQQVDVCRALDRTRESVRRDAMTEEELEQAREADRRRKAQRTL